MNFNKIIFLLLVLVSFNPFIHKADALAGDDPCSAIVLNPTQLGLVLSFDLAGTEDSGFSQPVCGNYQGNDFWLELVPLGTSITIETIAGTATDMAFEVYSNACQGDGNSYPYGCFQDFSCGTELMPKATIKDVIPNEKYYIRLWKEGGGVGTFDIIVVDSRSQPYIAIGDAEPLDLGGVANCIRLTENEPRQKGCAWYPTKIDFDLAFEMEFNLTFGSRDDGADGSTILFQPNSTSLCGNPGGQLAAGGIPNSVIVEFDTWFNGSFNDIAEDHTAISINGDLRNTIAGPVPLGNIEDGNIHPAKVTWDPISQLFEVYFDGTKQLSVNYDFINDVFNGESSVYWGITSSTGGEKNEQTFCFDNLVVQNSTSYEVDALKTICKGNSIMLGGELRSEPGTYDDVYNAANGCDSLVHTTLEIVEVTADAPLEYLLGCQPLVIDASSSITTSNTTYNWTTNDGGEIISGDEALVLTVNAPGTYTLNMIDLESGCSDGLKVKVLPTPELLADAGVEDIITCSKKEVFLNANSSTSGSDITYEWTTPDGNILSGESSTSPEINAAGIYILKVINNLTGCEEIDSVEVALDANLPELDLTVTEILTCNQKTVRIDKSINNVSNNTQIEWTLPDGSSILNETDEYIEVGIAGTYLINVENKDNGCTGLASVIVEEDIALPEIEILDFDIINCYQEEIDLGLLINAPDYSIKWSTIDGDFSIKDTENILVSEEATYYAVVENLQNGCKDSVAIDVVSDLEKPTVSAGNDAKLICTQTELVLAGTSNVENIDVIWSTNNGIIESGENTLTPKITSGGDYTIKVTNIDNGCINEDEVFIDQDENIPEINILPVGVLTCEHKSIKIDASQSSNSNIFDIQWLADDNQEILNNDGLTPTISEPGTYTLLIQNTENNCEKSIEINIEQDIEKPIVDLGNYPILDCDTEELLLGGSNSSTGDEFLYNWSLDNGTIEPSNISHPIINQPGTYSLIITNSDNGCTASSSVEIEQNIQLPILKMVDAEDITCNKEAIELNAEGSDFGANFLIEWSTQNGNIIKLNDDLHPVVDAEGDYLMKSTNLSTSCTDSLTISVLEYKDLPDVEIIGDYILSCQINELVLKAKNNSSGDFIYEWSSTDGNFLDANDKLQVQVDMPGIYQLKTINTKTGCETIESVEVFANATPPVADAGPDQLIDCNSQDHQTILDGSDSTAGLDYAWTTADGHIVSGEMTNKLTVDSAGTYILTVTDPLNNCSDTSSADVIVDMESPVVKVSDPKALNCVDTVVVLMLTSDSASGSDFTFSWSTFGTGRFVSGENTENPIVDREGNYTINVKNNKNECLASSGIKVEKDTLPPIVVIEIPEILSCKKTVVDVDGSGSMLGNPQNNMTYSWTTSDGSIQSNDIDQKIEVNEPGTYVLHLIDLVNKCEAMDSVTVLQDTISPMANAGSDGIINCFNPDLVINGTGSVGNEFSYEWTTDSGEIKSGNTTLMPTVSGQGRYTLTVLNSENGCTKESSVDITSDAVYPNIEIATPDILTCVDSIIDIEATITDQGTNPNLVWTPTNGGNIITDSDMESIAVNSSGTYTLVVTNPSNGCSETKQIMVSENVDYPNISIDAPPTINCENPTVQIVGSINGNCTDCEIVWNTVTGMIDTGESTLTPQVSADGYYYFNVLDKANGCLSLDSVLVNENIEPPTGSNFNIDQPLCHGDKGIISVLDVTGGLAPYTYSLNNVDFDALSTVTNDLNKGNYNLYIKDANGCVFVADFEVIEPDPLDIMVPNEIVLKFMADGQVNVVTNIPSNEIASVEWTPSEGLSCDTCLNPIVTALDNGIYNVEVINSNGCKINGSFRLIIDFELEVYIPNVITPHNGDGINDVFYVFAQDGVKSILSMNIYDRWGTQIFERNNFQPNNPSLGWDGQFNGKKLQSGVYAYWIQIELFDGRKVLYEGDVTILN